MILIAHCPGDRNGSIKHESHELFAPFIAGGEDFLQRDRFRSSANSENASSRLPHTVPVDFHLRAEKSDWLSVPCNNDTLAALNIIKYAKEMSLGF
jgi:hypothetical protein